MADKSFDVVIIGGGTKALSLGMYLQRYGGLQVGIFECRHEMGGGMCSEESPAPGFIADHHATDIADWYWEVALKDFPELKDRGLEWVPYIYPMGGVFVEDNDCWILQGPYQDPTGETTAKDWERFSPRDAETFLKVWKGWREIIRPALVKAMHTVAPLPHEPDEMEKAAPKFVKEIGLEEPFCYIQNPLELFRDLFESEALIAGLFRIGQSWDGASPMEFGMGLTKLFIAMGFSDYGNLKGGTHSSAHATYKVFTEDGGKCFTEHEVDRVIIEHGKARGIRLVDGTEIEAKKAVISPLDPHSMVFKLTGKEHWNPRTVRRVANLARWRITITWYTWALHELPRFDKAAAVLPEINLTGAVAIGSKDPDALSRNACGRYMGQWVHEPNLVSFQYSLTDKTRAPEGKAVILTEDFQPGANHFTAGEWKTIKRQHAQQVMDTFAKVSSNMTWDNVIGYVPLTPFDHCHMSNMAPTGNWGIIDHTPTQLGKYRPVPELARHKTPIAGFYATGSAWPPTAGCWPGQGYTCYKIMAEDFGLRKPWEEKGREY